MTQSLCENINYENNKQSFLNNNDKNKQIIEDFENK